MNKQSFSSNNESRMTNNGKNNFFHLSSSIFHHSTGQSLLEIVVAIGLVVVVATGITITTISGLKNSQFSQNQAQSTKLAQEGIEQVKTLKNRNCPVKTISGGTYYWTAVNLGDALVWDNITSISGVGKNYTPSLSVPGCELKEAAPLVGSVFTKKISLAVEPLASRQIRVISEVTWTDLSGTHSSKQETILADY